MMDPLLIDVPTDLATPRLHLRIVRPGDGKLICPSVRASLAELKPWMIWATDDYDEDRAEVWCRTGAADYLTRCRFHYLILERDREVHIGTAGAHKVDWKVPKCEVGYWLHTAHTGKGYMTEALGAIVKMLEETLKMRRIELRTDGRNENSRAVAHRAGFTLDAIFRNDMRDAAGAIGDTCVYSRINNPAD
jgi:ribosomal-protein-serine acetyltransferase